jgi:hypothetical protein
MELKITVRGNDIDSLVKALEEIKSGVKIGCTIGTGQNTNDPDNYCYKFETYSKSFVEEQYNPRVFSD